jgi:AAA+ superfamily predicted ATPase
MTSHAGAFDDVPRTARGHLGLLFYEAAYGVVRHARTRARAAGAPAAALLDDFPFIAAYANELQRRVPGIDDPETGGARLRDAIDAWESTCEAWLPLRALCAEGGLSPDTRNALVALGLAEEESGFAALFAALQAPLGHRRPTVGLLRAIVQHGAAAASDSWSICGTLVDAGLAEVVNADAPRSEWVLRTPSAVWSALRGEDTRQPSPGMRLSGVETLAPLHDLVITDAQRDRLREVSTLAQAGSLGHLIIRGTPGVDRLAAAAAVAHALGRGTLVIDVPDASQPVARVAGALCTLSRAVPVFVVELGPAETFTLPELPGYNGLVIVIAGREGGIAGAAGAALIELEPDAYPERLGHWRRALGQHAGESVEAIAEQYSLSGAHIRACAPVAIAAAAVAGERTVRPQDVRVGARAVGRQLLDSLATRLDAHGSWEDLVMTSSTEAELLDLARRCRFRERLARELATSLPGGINRGVRALFEGPSGTGKTLAARVLAAELGLDLYRVDLSAVVSKFVGETEKNLSRVFARAEDLDIVLLLDEGDALLTRRTDVRSANDRYANLETNYLLQRLETYSGIVVVTTNLAAQIDTAFRRRMDIVARFHLPDPERRHLLWLGHLPADHAIDAAAIEELAIRYAMSGGEIRNAVIHATLRAVARGSRLQRGDLVAAVETEHRKAGASFSIPEPAVDDTVDVALAGFLDVIQ